MKISELTESLAEEDVNNLIVKYSAALRRISQNFSTNANIYGYETAFVTARSAIIAMSESDFYIELISRSNPKVTKSFQKYMSLRNQILTKIKSGI